MGCLRASSTGLVAVVLLAASTVYAEESSSPVRALLVGCTDYDHPAIQDLAGPANDVRYFHELLIGKKFSVPDTPETIVELVGQQATRKNIAAQLEHLAQTAQQGEQIMILLSGHGARQEDTNEDEPDGMDEVFCPVDVQYLDETGSIADGGITDDEIGRWLSQMTQRGAHVWLVVDSCHNGTLTRGGSGSQGLVARGLGSPRISRGPDGGVSRETHDRPMEGVAAFYAAPPCMKTFETVFDGEKRGIFSRTICNVIANSKERLTYRRLLQKIQADYDRQGWRSPTPQLEVHDQASSDTVLLGDLQLKGSDLRIVAESEEGYVLNAGRLRDITPNTILAVHRSAEDTKPAGYVRVTESGTTRSTVVPFEYQGKRWDATKPIPLDGFCEIARSGLQELRRMKVAVGVYSQNKLDSFDKQPLSPETRQYWLSELQQACAAKEEYARLLEIVSSVEEADWVLRPATPNATHIVYLSPTDRFQQPLEEDRPLVFPSLDDAPQIPSADRESKVREWLSTKLSDIARSSNLISIAATELSDSDQQLPLVVQLRRIQDVRDKEGRPFSVDEDPTLHPDATLAEGEKVGLFVRNPNPFAVNVTVLFVDAQLHAEAHFPGLGRSGNQLAPAGEDGDQVMAAKLGIDNELPGTERFITIATRATPGEPHSFAYLASATRSAARSGERKKTTPFEALLTTAVSQPEATRSGPLQEPQYTSLEDHVIHTISWSTAPDPKKPKGLFAGPAEKLNASPVVEAGTKYHTRERTLAVLGSYGHLIPGNRLLLRPHGYESVGMIDDVDRIKHWKPFLHKTGTTSMKGLWKFMVSAEQWRVSGMAGINGSSQVTYEMKGQRLQIEDVCKRLERNPRALRYFRRVRQAGGVPIVITQNIVMSKCTIGRNVAWDADAKLHLAGLSKPPEIVTDGESRNDQDHKAPLVRCYLMHEVLVDNGEVDLARFPRR